MKEGKGRGKEGKEGGGKEKKRKQRREKEEEEEEKEEGKRGEEGKKKKERVVGWCGRPAAVAEPKGGDGMAVFSPHPLLQYMFLFIATYQFFFFFPF